MNFESYEQIFEQRGQSYHQAMALVPDARANEFRAAIRHLTLREGDLICDVPSGGGYLFNYLPDELDLQLLAIDPSSAFARQWDDPRIDCRLAPMHDIPVDDGAVDVVVSIAGLHHAEDRAATFAELRRIVRRGGQLGILEVACGSATDRFLNGFVDTYNPMGHRGRFVDDGFRHELALAGWELERDMPCRYTWDFPDQQTLIRFLTLMFGIELASPEQVLRGVDEILGLSYEGTRSMMNWELQLLLAH